MKFLPLPLTVKKIAKYLRNTLNHKTTKIFKHENFPSYGRLGLNSIVKISPISSMCLPMKGRVGGTLCIIPIFLYFCFPCQQPCKISMAGCVVSVMMMAWINDYVCSVVMQCWRVIELFIELTSFPTAWTSFVCHGSMGMSIMKGWKRNRKSHYPGVLLI